MEFGMKRVVASVQVVAIPQQDFTTAVRFPSHQSAKESKLSVSYLEQIFSKAAQQ